MDVLVMNKSDTITFIRSLLISQKEMYGLAEFLNDFEEEAGYTLPCFGYGSVLDFLKSLTNTLEVISSHKTLYLKVVECQKFAHVRSAILRSSDHFGVSSGVEQRVIDLEETSSVSEELGEPEPPPEDKPLGVIPKRGKWRRKRKPRRKNGRMNANPSAVANAVCPNCRNAESEHEKFHRENLHRNGMICIRCLEIEAEMDNATCIDDCISSIALDERDIPFVNLMDHVEVGDCVEVFVPEVGNPHKFILQFKKYRVRLAKLMDRMQIFYSLNFDKYKVRKYKFKTNQLCAAYYQTRPNVGEWYRAKMVEFGTEKCTVHLIDYGVTAEVHNSNVEYLDSSFTELPVQAIDGHLANIRPDGNYWSKKCNRKFFDLTFEKYLTAGVVEMDNERHWLSVVLSDEEDVYIGDCLVEERLAIFDFDSTEEKTILPAIFQSFNLQGLLQPAEMGRVRHPRSEVDDCDTGKSKAAIQNQRRKRDLRKMFSLDDSKSEPNSE